VLLPTQINSLPRDIRRAACQARRVAGDWIFRRSTKFADAKTSSESKEFSIQLSLEQPILKTSHVDSKIHNIGIAIRLIENVVIEPQQILSFWRLVGRPRPARGFQPGRSLLGGRIVADYGGGLCQLSGILYHLSLLAGLEIAERHPHSVDIYRDDERYTPLGADATVAWGFKDLRILNTLPVPFCFRFELKTEKIVAHLCALEKVQHALVQFTASADGTGERVIETWRKKIGECEFTKVAHSTYITEPRHAPQPIGAI
jgi:vancomycin resistance protein VanW